MGPGEARARRESSDGWGNHRAEGTSFLSRIRTGSRWLRLDRRKCGSTFQPHKKGAESGCGADRHRDPEPNAPGSHGGKPTAHDRDPPSEIVVCRAGEFRRSDETASREVYVVRQPAEVAQRHLHTLPGTSDSRGRAIYRTAGLVQLPRSRRETVDTAFLRRRL